MKSNFSTAWDAIGPENELQDSYSLTEIKSLKEAVKLITKHLGMTANERTDTVEEGKSSHLLLLAGIDGGLDNKQQFHKVSKIS